MVESTYLPVITANVLGAYQGAAGSNSSFGFNLNNSGNLFGSAETVSLAWLLFDFGGRKNIVDSARKLSTYPILPLTALTNKLFMLFPSLTTRM